MNFIVGLICYPSYHVSAQIGVQILMSATDR